MTSPTEDRTHEKTLWADFCRPSMGCGQDGWWIPNSPITILADKDACVEAAEYDQKAKDKLIRYAIWRLKS